VSGRATLRIGIALVLVGAVFDSPSLYVPGAALAILSLGLRAWAAAAARVIRVRRVAGPWSVVEGEPYPVELRIEGTRLPAPGLELHDPVVGKPVALPMQAPRRLRVEGRLPRRGRHRLEPATLRIGDPLGLAAAEVESTGSVEVLVLPRVEPVVTADGEGGGIHEEQADGSERGIGGAGLDTGAIEFEIDGLRPYRDGTPASRIHWPTVARRGELVEYKLVTGGRASPLVLLDASDPVDDESLDKAVRAAASLCVHLARAGGCGIQIPGARLLEIDPGLRSWPTAHGLLALVKADAMPLPRRRSQRMETVFWVSAAATPPRIAEAGGRGFLVSPHIPPGGRREFTVAGCDCVRLDSVLGPGAIARGPGSATRERAA
jgi:uncharacterized protein (DUF58 family)